MRILVPKPITQKYELFPGSGWGLMEAGVCIVTGVAQTKSQTVQNRSPPTHNSELFPTHAQFHSSHPAIYTPLISVLPCN